MAQTININITESQPDTQTSAQAFVTDDGPPPTSGGVLAESHDELSAPAPSGSDLDEAAAFDDATAPGPEDFFHEGVSDLNVAPQPDMTEMTLSDTSDEHVPMPDEFYDPELTNNVIPEPKEQPVAEKKKSTRAKK